MEDELGGLSKIGKDAGKRLGDGLAAGVDAAAKRVEQASAKVVDARNKEADAAGKVRVAEAKLESLRQKGVTDAGRLASAEERVATSKRAHSTASTALARDIAQQASAQDRLATATKRADAAGSGFGGKLRAALSGVHGDAGRATGAIGALAGKLTSMVGLGSVLALPGLALSKGFSRLQSIDEAKAKLTALGQDAGSVEMIMKNALASVDKTSFGLGDAAGVAGVIVGAGVKPGEELERTLKQVADTAAITGGELSDIGSIYGKVAASGKLDGDVLAQLLDRQIGLLPKLAEHYGVTADEAKKMVSDGKVSFQDFQTVMGNLVGGGAEKMGKTFGATMANMSAALGRLGAAVLGPLFEKLPGLFTRLTGVVDGVTPKLKSIGDVFAKYSGWLTPIAAAIGAVTAAMVVWKTATVIMTAVQTAFNVVLAANPIGLIVLAIVGLVAALVVAYQRSETFRKIVDGVWNAIKAVIGAVVSWFTDIAWPAIRSAWDFITNAFSNGKEIIGVAIDAVKAIWQGLIDKAGEVWEGVTTKFTAVVDFVKGLPSAITNAAKGMWEGLKSGLATVLNWIGDKWNAFADGLSFDIPGTDIGVSIPKMPRFSDGGYTGNGSADQAVGVVHGGEFVVRKESTDRIQNAFPGLLDYLNNKGALPMPGYARGGLVAGTAELGRIISEKFGISNIGGWRPEDKYGEHSTGRALDVMTPNKSKGDAVKDFAIANASAIDLKWAIWQQRMWYPDGRSEAMPDRGNPTQNHMDHVHIFSGAGVVKGLRGSLGGVAADPGSSDMMSTLGVEPAQSPSMAAPGGTGGGSAESSSGMNVSGSISQLPGIGLGGLGVTTQVTPDSQERTFDIGGVASDAISGQVSSAMSFFGAGDSPGWLKGLSTLANGISVSGGDGMAPVSAAPLASAATGAIGGVVHGANTGQRPGPQVNYNIQTTDIEPAYLASQRIEKERAAANLARY